MLKCPAIERGIFEFDFSTKFHDKLDKFFFVDSYYYFPKTSLCCISLVVGIISYASKKSHRRKRRRFSDTILKLLESYHINTYSV